MAREMLINVAESEECRVVVVEDGVLEELYVERASLGSQVGNIYKGKVVNIEPSIQAAFIDFGVGKNGFLHISDLHPRYFSGTSKKSADRGQRIAGSGQGAERYMLNAILTESIGRRKSLKERPPIQKCLNRGDELVVQVTKEGMDTKGPTLSTYLALPGKYLVMMPWMRGQGISHKIEAEEERARLREILQESKPPKGAGFIIRTAGQGCSKRDIQNDLKYLWRLWRAIENRIETERAPAELYQESDLVIRTLRDVFNRKIGKIICDSEKVVRRIRDFLGQAYPRLKPKVIHYKGRIPLFHKYQVEEEIAKVACRTVELEGGGSIVIEQTEALVSVDVNSGRYRKYASGEQTAYRTNMVAAVEIARQIRLRDVGGLIICDFIDMRDGKHRRDVERAFRQAVKADRARVKILRMSRFGVIEMTRQRMRPSLASATYLACPHCGGSGFIKSHESLAVEIIRLLNLSVSKEQIKRIELFVSPEVGDYLQNEKRDTLARIEQVSSKRIIIHSTPDYAGEKYGLVCYNERGRVVKL